MDISIGREIRVCLILLFLLGSSVVSQGQEPSTSSLVVATYNINWGNPELNAVAKSISESKADIVCLQETTARSERFLSDNFRKVYPHSRFIGGEGNWAAERFGILSRHPIQEAKFSPAQHGLFGTYLLKVRHGKETLQIANVHLSPFFIRGERTGLKAVFAALLQLEQTHRKELESLLDILDPKLPTLIAGDFNSLSNSHALKQLTDKAFQDSFAAVTDNPDRHHTWHWQFPNKFELKFRVDYIFHSRHFKTESSEILRSAGSDHFLLKSKLSYSHEVEQAE